MRAKEKHKQYRLLELQQQQKQQTWSPKQRARTPGGVCEWWHYVPKGNGVSLAQSKPKLPYCITLAFRKVQWNSSAYAYIYLLCRFLNSIPWFDVWKTKYQYPAIGFYQKLFIYQSNSLAFSQCQTGCFVVEKEWSDHSAALRIQQKMVLDFNLIKHPFWLCSAKHERNRCWSWYREERTQKN